MLSKELHRARNGKLLWKTIVSNKLECDSLDREIITKRQLFTARTANHSAYLTAPTNNSRSIEAFRVIRANSTIEFFEENAF